MFSINRGCFLHLVCPCPRTLYLNQRLTKKIGSNVLVPKMIFLSLFLFVPELVKPIVAGIAHYNYYK